MTVVQQVFDSKWFCYYCYTNSKCILKILNASVFTFIPIVKCVKHYLLTANFN